MKPEPPIRVTSLSMGAANRASGLSPQAWREIQQRGGPLGLDVELLDDGRELRVTTRDAGERIAP